MYSHQLLVFSIGLVSFAAYIVSFPPIIITSAHFMVTTLYPMYFSTTQIYCVTAPALVLPVLIYFGLSMIAVRYNVLYALPTRGESGNPLPLFLHARMLLCFSVCALQTHNCRRIALAEDRAVH